MNDRTRLGAEDQSGTICTAACFRKNRRSAGGAYVAEPTATWLYDDALLVGTATKAVGLLIEQGSGSATKQFTYDRFGRSLNVTTHLEGTARTRVCEKQSTRCREHHGRGP